MRSQRSAAAVLAAALVPWAAVLVFWTLLHSAWATILAYHAAMLLVSRRELARAFRGWDRRLFLVGAVPCILAGPLTWLLLPSITVIQVGDWMAAFGLAGTSLLVLIPYYGLVHPFVEQAHWSSLRSDPRLGLVSSLLFAGYHGLVLSTLMKPLWVGLCVAVLIATSISWRWIEERCGGGLLVPALTQVVADAGMIVAAVLRAR